MELPNCCQNCRHIPQEAKNYLPDVHSCWLRVILPYKKQTCKRQEPPNKEVANVCACGIGFTDTLGKIKSNRCSWCGGLKSHNAEL